MVTTPSGCGRLAFVKWYASLSHDYLENPFFLREKKINFWNLQSLPNCDDNVPAYSHYYYYWESILLLLLICNLCLINFSGVTDISLSYKTYRIWVW